MITITSSVQEAIHAFKAGSWTNKLLNIRLFLMENGDSTISQRLDILNGRMELKSLKEDSLDLKNTFRAY